MLSSRVRTGRSIKGICLPPHCTRAERRKVEQVSLDALACLDGDFKGQYYSLETMSEEDQEKLINDHFMFDKPVSPLLTASRMARDWPDARGERLRHLITRCFSFDTDGFFNLKLARKILVPSKNRVLQL